MPGMLRNTVWSLLIGSAAVVGGTYLYTVYGPRKHRGPAGLATGLLVGQQVGAVAGFALGGPAGVFPGAMAGGVAGAVLGHDLVTPDSVEARV